MVIVKGEFARRSNTRGRRVDAVTRVVFGRSKGSQFERVALKKARWCESGHVESSGLRLAQGGGGGYCVTWSGCYCFITRLEDAKQIKPLGAESKVCSGDAAPALPSCRIWQSQGLLGGFCGI